MRFLPSVRRGRGLPSRRVLSGLTIVTLCLAASAVVSTSRSVGAADGHADPTPGNHTGLAPGALNPVSSVLADVNVRFAVASDAVAAEAPAPPVACPAPEATFVDSWRAPRSGGRAHQGVDMMAPSGSPALAPVAGVIRSHYSGLGGLSYYLDGDDGNEYFGTHLQTMTAQGRVAAGEQVGTVGSTGNASTPHLHFEVKLGGTTPVNPYPFAVQFCS